MTAKIYYLQTQEISVYYPSSAGFVSLAPGFQDGVEGWYYQNLYEDGLGGFGSYDPSPRFWPSTHNATTNMELFFNDDSVGEPLAVIDGSGISLASISTDGTLHFLGGDNGSNVHLKFISGDQSWPAIIPIETYYFDGRFEVQISAISGLGEAIIESGNLTLHAYLDRDGNGGFDPGTDVYFANEITVQNNSLIGGASFSSVSGDFAIFQSEPVDGPDVVSFYAPSTAQEAATEWVAITFDEPIQFGDYPSAFIVQQDGYGGIRHAYLEGEFRSRIDGDTLYINLGAFTNLDFNTNYVIGLYSEAIADLDGNYYEPSSEFDGWDFSTGIWLLQPASDPWNDLPVELNVPGISDYFGAGTGVSVDFSTGHVWLTDFPEISLNFDASRLHHFSIKNFQGNNGFYEGGQYVDETYYFDLQQELLLKWTPGDNEYFLGPNQPHYYYLPEAWEFGWYPAYDPLYLGVDFHPLRAEVTDIPQVGFIQTITTNYGTTVLHNPYYTIDSVFDDLLIGGDGEDTLRASYGPAVSGEGVEEYQGGAGNDRFRFEIDSGYYNNLGTVYLSDYEQGERIDVSISGITETNFLDVLTFNYDGELDRTTVALSVGEYDVPELFFVDGAWLSYGFSFDPDAWFPEVSFTLVRPNNSLEITVDGLSVPGEDDWLELTDGIHTFDGQWSLATAELWTSGENPVFIGPVAVESNGRIVYPLDSNGLDLRIEVPYVDGITIKDTLHVESIASQSNWLGSDVLPNQAILSTESLTFSGGEKVAISRELASLWGHNVTSTPGLSVDFFYITDLALGNLGPNADVQLLVDVNSGSLVFDLTYIESYETYHEKLGQTVTLSPIWASVEPTAASFPVGGHDDAIDLSAIVLADGQVVGQGGYEDIFHFDHESPSADGPYLIENYDDRYFTQFSEPVHFTQVGLDITTGAREYFDALFVSDSEVNIETIWVRELGYWDEVNGWREITPQTQVEDIEPFDQVIFVTPDTSAKFALRQPLDIQSITANTDSDGVTWTVIDPSNEGLNDGYRGVFTITGYDSGAVKAFDGAVQTIDISSPILVAIDPETGTRTSSVADASVSWSNVQVNTLTSEFRANLTVDVRSAGELTSAIKSGIESAITPQALKANITRLTSAGVSDDAGNILDGGLADPVVFLGALSPTDKLYEPDTGSDGPLDTLDVTALGSGTYVDVEYGRVLSGSSQFLISDFGRYKLAGSQNLFEGSAGTESVWILGEGGDNQISGGGGLGNNYITYTATDAGGGLAVDLGADGVVGPDGDTRDWIEVIRGDGTDYINQINHFSGSNAGDDITGTAGFEILQGEGGDDEVTGSSSGAIGGDLLVGGVGVDTLIGSSGYVDVLVDLDGAAMRGRETPWTAGQGRDDCDRDVFIVRESSTISNFALSANDVHLSGRTGYAADRVVFALDTVAVVAAAMSMYRLGSGETDPSLNPNGFSFNYTQEFKEYVSAFVRDHLIVESQLVGEDLKLILTDGTKQWGEATIKGVGQALGSEAEAHVVRLDKYQASAFDAIEYASDTLSGYVGENGSEAAVVAEANINATLSDWVLSGSNEILIPVSLEAVKAGTIGDSSPGKVMASKFGILDIADREYVPGYGDQHLLGGMGSDRYKFVVQDFTEESGGVSGDAGRDTVIDSGGHDDLYLGASTIDDIHLQAFRKGREVDANSLRITHEQSTVLESGIDLVNSGQIEWLGAYRDGGRYALETVTLKDASDNDVIYYIAQADHDQTRWDLWGEDDSFEAGRSLIADLDISKNWIVVGTEGESDIIKITGTEAWTSGSQAWDIRVFGFDRDLDLVDISENFEVNARSYFDLQDIPELLTKEDREAFSVEHLSDNSERDDIAKFRKIYAEAQSSEDRELIAALYFMDYDGSIDDLPIYIGLSNW